MKKQHQWHRNLLGAFFLLILATGCSQLRENQGQPEAGATQGPAIPSTPTEPAAPPATPSPFGAPTALTGLPPAQQTPLMPAHPGSEGTIEPGMEPLVQIARADLAERLGIAEDEITVLEARAVVWPDASLGCPQPGMSYIQILFEGGLIRLEAGGQEYNYHSGEDAQPFLCEPSR